MAPPDTGAAMDRASPVAGLLQDLLQAVVLQHEPRLAGVVADPGALAALPAELRRAALHFYGLCFALVATADERAAAELRHAQECEVGEAHMDGTFEQALSRARAARVEPAVLQQALERLRVEPVLTAHPTESRRVTVMEAHRRIYLRLAELGAVRVAPRERRELERALRDDVELLWLTGALRTTRPGVSQEVSWALHFFTETLYEAAPRLARKLRATVAHVYPEIRPPARPPLTFGSWVGGDRDGNPNVTPETSRQTLFRLRRHALYLYRAKLRELGARLSLAEHAVKLPTAFLAALDERLKPLGGDGRRIRSRNLGEPCRQWVQVMAHALEQSISVAEAEEGAPRRFSGYRAAGDLLADVDVLGKALRACGCDSVVDSQLAPLRTAIEIFGFRTASLDLRENSAVVTQTLQHLWSARVGAPLGECPAWHSPEWKRWIEGELAGGRAALPDTAAWPEMARRTLDLFRMLAAARTALDPQAIGCFVLSMTRNAADLLGVYLLAKTAGLFEDPDDVERCTLLVVPLFETIADLAAAPAIMRDIFRVPLVKRSLRAHGSLQPIMIGYSDSNKDGGFLTANWQLALAQKRLTQEAARARLAVEFFHGRGGSVSRGGAPLGRAIAAQPPDSVAGRLRLTEQGESASGRYANLDTASDHLERLLAGVLDHTLAGQRRGEPEFDEAMDALSGMAYTAYRRLLDHPGFFAYFQAASPVEEFSLLNLGSRPARRFGLRGLSDLRAIPWVFAWTQNRQLVPAWYGVGTALADFLRVRGADGRALLHRMFEQSPIFRLVIDEVEKAMALVDLDVAQEYAGLVPVAAVRGAVSGMIREEFERTRSVLLDLVGEAELAARFPSLRHRLDQRRPILRAIGREQVDVLARFRALAGQKPAEKLDLTVALLLSFNAVATGMGWTG